MGSDNLFNKHKEERKIRKINTIKQRSSRWLIVCEGKQTEPNYFKEAIDFINEGLEEQYKLKVTIEGKGMNTMSLVNSVEELFNSIDKHKLDLIPYSKIFVVFDKDDFKPTTFDSAINKCEKKGYIPLWSNQAIEYWFLLHFNYIDGKLDRSLYTKKLNQFFKEKGLNYKYKKNDKELYSKLIKYGSLEKARKYALQIHMSHKKDKPSKSESCTTIYKFFDVIDERLKELE